LTCIDARVDPAHVLGLELGDAVVFRNNGGRLTPAFIDEVTSLAALVAKMTGAAEASFRIVLMEHTKCGAQAFADPEFRAHLQDRTKVDVSSNAITNQEENLIEDVNRLRDAPYLPSSISVAAMLYDVETGLVREILPDRTLADLRDEDG
jgi:carbonic anhydrase